MTNRRADARRNFELILDSAERCLARDPDASVADIAEEAGLGRVTIYGHFASRTDLVEKVSRRVLANANEMLAQIDLAGDVVLAFKRLVAASWEATVRAGSVITAAEKALPSSVLRDMHTGELEDRVRRLLSRGQSNRDFRADLSTDWLVAVFHATLHAAALEIEAGRLDRNEATGVITETLLGVYLPPRTPT
ncbi:MAG TPA: helix-turn-helix domain-containing protein [Acidimicrobiia bacterium]|nr:helix-turn-helix domain-containing protein [Acidimicrobiia bacterium]